MAETTAARRLLLGMSTLQDIDQVMAAAGDLVAGRRAEILCLLAEQEDLLRLAGLPFARTVRPGGGSLPVSLAAVEEHFAALSRAVERQLGAFGQKLAVPWQLLRQTGDTMLLFEERVEEGDILIVSREELLRDAQRFLAQTALLLEKAEALVVPAERPERGPVVAVTPAAEGGRVAEVAQRIARGSGRTLRIIQPEHFGRARGEGAIIVEPFGWAVSLGTSSLLRQLRSTGLTTVLVGNQQLTDG